MAALVAIRASWFATDGRLSNTGLDKAFWFCMQMTKVTFRTLVQVLWLDLTGLHLDLALLFSKRFSMLNESSPQIQMLDWWNFVCVCVYLCVSVQHLLCCPEHYGQEEVIYADHLTNTYWVMTVCKVLPQMLLRIKWWISKIHYPHGA